MVLTVKVFLALKNVVLLQYENEEAG